MNEKRELIDRKALLERMKDFAAFAVSYKPYMSKEDIAESVLKQAKEQALEFVEEAPTIKAVPLSEIYRIIAGHSDYHGDSILAAMTCIAEGKEVKPTRPIEAVPVVHGEWAKAEPKGCVSYSEAYAECSVCNEVVFLGRLMNFCPSCGAKMDGKAESH